MKKHQKKKHDILPQDSLPFPNAPALGTREGTPGAREGSTPEGTVDNKPEETTIGQVNERGRSEAPDPDATN
jgi:hypothetical protein